MISTQKSNSKENHMKMKRSVHYEDYHNWDACVT